MKRLIPLILALGALLTLAAQPAQAQRAGWTTPFEISPLRTAEGSGEQRYGSSWFPSVAADPLGTVHVTWYSGIALPEEGAGNSLDLLMHRELGPRGWSEVSEAIAPTTGGFTVRNSLVAGQDGRLHVAFRQGTRIVYASAPLEQAQESQAWSTPVLISGFGAAYYVELAADSTGGLHVVFTEAVSAEDEDGPACPNCADLFYRHSRDGGNSWSAPLNLSRTPDGDNRPQIKIDSLDRIHVVWDQGIDWYSGGGEPNAGVYVRSDDGGTTWTAPTQFRLPRRAVEAARRAQQAAREPGGRPTPTPMGTPQASVSTEPTQRLDAVQQTTLGLDERGNPVVVYRGVAINSLYSQHSLDGGDTWTQPTEIPGLIARPSDLDIYSMATDSSGTVHLLMVGFPLAEAARINDFTPPGLWHLAFRGSGWQLRGVVVRNDLYPEYPKLAVGGGNVLHAVWFTRSREDLFTSERARYRVWHSTLRTGAPPAQPPPTFTPGPTATPVAVTTPTPAPSPTALPLAAIESPPIASRPAWEGPGLAIVALSLLAAIVLIGAILLIRHLTAGRGHQ